MTRSEAIEKAYKMGQQHTGIYSSVNEAVDCDPELYKFPVEMMIAYEAGFSGCEMPYTVTGWRYGNIPTSGASHNYAEGKQEAGVSLMEADNGMKTQDALSAMFITAKNRPVVKVTGYLNTVKRGSDGEPLVFWASEIK
jgi:hypothetical protein